MEEDQLNFKIILIGGSAGSLDVLMKVLPQLTHPITFALVIVLHRKSADDSILEELVALKTPVPVMEIDDKTPLLPGFIYIAPSDYHLLFENDGLLSLDASEKVNFSRPSIDVSFESAAEAYKFDVTGILLSGANSDGANGLVAIKKNGGIAVVQDPKTAEMPYMPNSAIEKNIADYILDVDGIVEFIFRSNIT